MKNFNIIAESDKDTVVSIYDPIERKNKNFQSEDELEKDFIKKLTEQGYEYISINNEEDLIINLRKQLEELNNYSFSDEEWKRIFNDFIANSNDSILEKTRKIQEENYYALILDEGITKNIKLIDKEHVHNNHLQVINQYSENKGIRSARYDVTILINGLPMVHIELKKRGIDIREAFNQINRYQREDFWASSGLFQYIQLFVISNGTYTKYYSNTTRENHIKDPLKKNSNKKKTSNSFEFTSYWADAKNIIIPDLVDFTKTFFAKHTLLNILTKYCIFTSDNQLLVMRPYQIVATEKIINKIEISINQKKFGHGVGGYIWHTTGSGKTLTSFKTAQIASKLKSIQKVLFVVDRKDLDYQTMREYDKFEKGAANSNTSTKILQKQIQDPNVNIIITTIQKLGNFVSKNPKHEIYNKHVVMIFDECHRSQFGEMHKNITKHFKKYNLFGFTGTPIFSVNSSSSYKDPNLKTTYQAFGGELDENGQNTLALHSYTIVNAINDKNVLPFRIDYINTFSSKDNINDKDVKTIDREAVFKDPKRISLVTEYILKHFEQKTYRNQNQSNYYHKVITNINAMAKSKNNTISEEKSLKVVNGFNSIFCVDSISSAIDYYNEFKKQMDPEYQKLKIATIFSFNPNEEEVDKFDIDDVLQDENFDVNGLDKSSRDFLDMAIEDYNKLFKTSYDTSGDKFPNYYKDISSRMKNREIDLLIVVNMFLTGFDATTLNTLWVDKNLKQHGLIQAFSRTNRILNSVKTFGNIVCFRNLEEKVKEAISIFGNDEDIEIVTLRTYEEYLNGFTDNKNRYHDGYIEIVNDLREKFSPGEIINGEENRKKFIMLFGKLLSCRNIISCFDNFIDNKILPDFDFQEYKGMYLMIYQDYKQKTDLEKERINEDIVFEIELMKQVEINIDYILKIIEEYQNKNETIKEIPIEITRAINSSVFLLSKKDLIEKFVEQVSNKSDGEKDWQKFIENQKNNDLELIINEEKLDVEKTHKYIQNSFRDYEIKTHGTDISEIMPKISRFGENNDRSGKKSRVIRRIVEFFEKYIDLI